MTLGEDSVWGSLAARFVFVSFTAFAVWSSVPLTIRVLTTLKRRKGLYFWSILITSWGLCIRAIGYVIQWLVPSVSWIATNILAELGWVAMVSGFSCVLYSRLNLIVESQRIRRLVLATIITNGVIFHTAITILDLGVAAEMHNKDANSVADTARWWAVFKPWERTQIPVFCSQETLISFFYVNAAHQYLRSTITQKAETRRAMWLLIGVQVVIVVLDIALITIDSLGFLELKVFIHSFIYSVKLELEFVVLNQLVELSQLGVPGMASFSGVLRSGAGNHTADVETPEFMTKKGLDWKPPRSPELHSRSSTDSEPQGEMTVSSPGANSVPEASPGTQGLDVKPFPLDHVEILPNA